MVALFDTPITANDQSLERVLNAGLPLVLVLLDGAAPADLDAAMRTLAREQAGKLLVVKIPARENPAAAARFGLRRFPALAAIKNGQAAAQAEGITPADLTDYAAFLLGLRPLPAQRAGTGPVASAAARSAPSTGPSTPYQPSPTASAAPSSARPVTVTDATFEAEVMRSSVPVLVDFWAPWCGPCRMVAPTLEKMAGEMPGRLKIAKVNVDENPMVAGRYGVQSIPTMMLVKNGRIADRWAGALPEPALRSRVLPQI